MSYVLTELNNGFLESAIEYLHKRKDIKEESRVHGRDDLREFNSCLNLAKEKIGCLSEEYPIKGDTLLNQPDFIRKSKSVVLTLISNISSIFVGKKYKKLNDKINEKIKNGNFEEVLGIINQYIEVWQRIDSFDKK